MNRPVYFLYLILVILGTYSCTSTQKIKQEKDSSLVFMENQCYTCHSPDASETNRLAPPMAGVKRHYLENGTSEKQFIESFVQFLMNPTIEKSKMPGAVRRFNVMPKIEFDQEDIAKVAKYIYNNDIAQPEWFEQHIQKENQMGYTKTDTSLLEKGRKLSLAAQKELGQKLISAINTGGTDHALSFCSQKALSITDSMAVALNTKLKRVSNKNRNPKNAANKNEIAYIQLLKENISKGQDAKPLLSSINGKNLGYYPIITNNMCLQCHGNTDKIKESTKKLIGLYYPQDKAINYEANQIRGLWVVEFD